MWPAKWLVEINLTYKFSFALALACKQACENSHLELTNQVRKN
jgi:hypothetical protein